mgnify:CR=1 FL=1|jgi:hypothetical protein
MCEKHKELVNGEDFINYVELQNEGIINMWDRESVMELTGLDKKQIGFIMENYEKLEQKYKDELEIERLNAK